jgi:hypothetical protein
MDFDTVFAARLWKPIRNCPGRFVLADGALESGPVALVPGAQPQEFTAAGARDAVVVTPLVTGGLISYKRRDGTFLHTLNTAEGFARKLADLGIELPVDVVSAAEFRYKNSEGAS